MTPKEKQADLKRHRDIVLATIDYILQQIESEGLPKNDFEAVTGYYKQQKQQIEKYFQMSRLTILQRRLRSFIIFPMRRADLTFNEYIKEKTGYEIDIFESLRIRVEEIIAQKQIKNKEQLGEIFIMLEVYRQTSVGQEQSDTLKNLLTNYANQTRSAKISKR